MYWVCTPVWMNGASPLDLILSLSAMKSSQVWAGSQPFSENRLLEFQNPHIENT